MVFNSNPTKTDWDNDGATDDEDATTKVANREINYILFDAADEAVILESRMAYCNYFRTTGLDYQLVPILTLRQFSYFFEYLEYGFDVIVFNGWQGDDDPDYAVDCPGGFNHLSGKRYAYVNELIMVFHGGVGFLDLEHINSSTKYGSVKASSLTDPDNDASLLNCSQIPIKHIDCQFCFSSKYTASEKCIAIELLKITHAESVYGTTGELINAYGFLYVNGSPNDKYYWYSLGKDNQVYRNQGVKVADFMFRFEGRSAPNIRVEDYPK